MISIVLCVISFSISFIAARRSLVAGLVATLAVGYAYGIARANLAETFSHFIFDAAVFGLYLSQLVRRTTPEGRRRVRKLRNWMKVLILWPVLLFFLPAQDPMVEFVGLRSAIFLLPFLLIGAQLDNEQLYNLCIWIAGLNVAAFALAAVEFVAGVERFFPNNAVTQIIYASRDVAGYTAFRIPSSFTSSHAYAGTMVMTIPLLVGAWQQKGRSTWRLYLLVTALVASILGTFMAAARIHAVVLFILIVVITASSRVGWVSRFGWIIMLAGIGWIV